MPFPVTFATLPQGNQPLSLLDQQFADVALGMNIGCNTHGNNDLILTPFDYMPTPPPYQNFLPKFVFAPPQTSSGPITISVAGGAALKAYGSNGGVALGAGDLVAGNVYECLYWGALNSGAGGFVVNSQTPITSQGSWVPVLQGSSVAGTPVYVTQSGTYEQIGRQVTARFSVVTSAVTGIAGNVQIGGLPFPNNSSDQGFAYISIFFGWTAVNYTFMGGFINTSTSAIQLLKSAQGQPAGNVVAAEVAASSQFSGVASYHV